VTVTPGGAVAHTSAYSRPRLGRTAAAASHPEQAATHDRLKP
jgi:hypothetical protein